VAAIRSYQTQYLAVRSWQEVYAGTTTMVQQDWWYGYRYGMGTSVSFGLPWVVREDRWGVFRGPHRISNLDYLTLVGRSDERVAVERKIRSKQRLGTAYYVLAGTGGAATVASLVGMNNARTVVAYEDWRTVGLVGVTALFGGVIGGSFPTAKARRLAGEPSEIRTFDEIQQEILEHNEALRLDLGLTAREALEVDGSR